MVKIKHGSFIVELVLYVFLSLLLARYLFVWFDMLMLNVKKIAFQINSFSQIIIAHVKFLQTVNSAPFQESDWLIKNDTRCCWKNVQGTVCLYYKNGLLIQKIHSYKTSTKTRLILLSNISEGVFRYDIKNNCVRCLAFYYQLNTKEKMHCHEKEFFLVAKTFYGSK